MSSGEAPRNWSQIEIQRMVGSSFLHPIITEEVRPVCEDGPWRVEHNRVRNVSTDTAGVAIRVVPADNATYVSVVVPLMLDGRIVLVGRYRYPLGHWSIEFPRSHCQSQDSGWKQVAGKQLARDAGLKAAKMSLLGAIEPDTALATVQTIVILAEGCVERGSKPAGSRELIAGTVAVSPDELNHLVRRGEINCGITLAALYLYAALARR